MPKLRITFKRVSTCIFFLFCISVITLNVITLSSDQRPVSPSQLRGEIRPVDLLEVVQFDETKAGLNEDVFRDTESHQSTFHRKLRDQGWLDTKVVDRAELSLKRKPFLNQRRNSDKKYGPIGFAENEIKYQTSKPNDIRRNRTLDNAGSYFVRHKDAIEQLRMVHNQIHKNTLGINVLRLSDVAHLETRSQEEETSKRNIIVRYPIADQNTSDLFPTPDTTNDRILTQMNHVPKSYNPLVEQKVILYMSANADIAAGSEEFMKNKCPVNRCVITYQADQRNSADAIIINYSPFFQNFIRPKNQIWIWWNLESPFHSPSLQEVANQINWTATYRLDSTIVTPYEKFVPFEPHRLNRSKVHDVKKGNGTQTKMVAWFVSNCWAQNKRLQYAEELALYVEVDIYGSCGKLSCNRNDASCDKKLRQEYKFYLAFENSNCKQYITEKFFTNALWNDVVPIVMGGRKEDYLAVAPPNSFIHVEDFKSPKELADYLKLLDSNDHLYNKYFEWKGTGEFINTKYWCRVCAMLHMDPMPIMWYEDIEAWWKGPNTCTKDRWDRQEDYIKNWYGEY